MLITIRGRQWRLRFVKLRKSLNAWGRCDPPDAPRKSIRIDKSATGERKLATLVHEMLHAACWDLDEQAVQETADDIARVLTRLGYHSNESDAKDGQQNEAA